jgi:hypothetical protein
VDNAVQVPIQQQDGESWETAYSTIQAGVDKAVSKSIGSWAVWVRGESPAIAGGNPYCDGIYNEIVSIYPNRDSCIYVFGGFNGTEEPYTTELGGAELAAKERSWINNPTYIDGTNITSGAMQLVTISRNVHIDGFTFCNGELLGGPIGFASGNVNSIISNSIIQDNYAIFSVGGITVSGGALKIVNCLFRNNNGGSGILYLSGSAIVDVINCTLDDNSASSIIYESSSATANITNSILWDNTAYQQVINGSPAITYSCVQGGYTGTGNINQDPVFVDAIPALSYGSPCIDAGTITGAPNHDIMKNPRPIGYGVDMGAYEGVYSTDFEGVVAINEVLAENETTNQDEDEDYSPWLGLHNTSLSNVSLQGWTLTHGATYWTFPNITLAAGEYKLVFLSGKNRAGAELHTNFTLSSQGGTILLQDNQTPVVNYMYFDYPADMQADVSYGFNESDNIDPEDKGLIPILPMRPPTPELRNDTYFGHALVLDICGPSPGTEPYFESQARDSLPALRGWWLWKRGYVVTAPDRVDILLAWVLSNVNKFDIFVVNAHGNAVAPDNGAFLCHDYACHLNTLAPAVNGSTHYKFIFIDSCYSGVAAEGWKDAFNASTFLGWDVGVEVGHSEWFHIEFFEHCIENGQQPVGAAALNAQYFCLTEHNVGLLYIGKPVAEPVTLGNEELRLDIPNSMLIAK